MHSFFYYSGIVLWIGIGLFVMGWLALICIAHSIPNEVDDTEKTFKY